MKRFLIIPVIAILFFSACDSGSDSSSWTQENPAPAMTSPSEDFESNEEETFSSGYPDVIRDNYMNGCTNGGGDYNYCLCTLNAFEATYSAQEFLSMEQEYVASGMLPDEMISVALDCL